MKRLIALLFLCVQVFLLQGCVERGKPIIAVGTPRFVPQSPPDSVQERGIRQDPNTGGIILQWFADPGASGYKLYRSDTLDSDGNPVKFQMLANIGSASELKDTSTVDISVTSGVKYSYYLTAYASDGSSSASSDTINYELLNRPGLGYPPPNGSVDVNNTYFSWGDLSGGGYTVIRLEDISQLQPVVVWVTKRFQVFESYPTRLFNFDSTATEPLLPNHSYRWRVERFQVNGTGRPYQGSTSGWSLFSIK